MENNVKVGGIYKHFKGTLYVVMGIGVHTETEESMIIYKAYKDTDKSTIWIRPYKDFISKVDKIKYPTIEQEYRFEFIKMIIEE